MAHGKLPSYLSTAHATRKLPAATSGAQQLELTAAAIARENAIADVDEAADPDWKVRALAAVKRLCQARADFISDDIWTMGLDHTREDRALGPVLMAAAKAGWCRKTDRVRPSVHSHLSGKPVWRSLLYGTT